MHFLQKQSHYFSNDPRREKTFEVQFCFGEGKVVIKDYSVN